MIAALYVEKNGPYSEVPDVDLWYIERDARQYKGPHKVIAHPPCERWGSLFHGGLRYDGVKFKKKLLGDDAGCFAHALWAVRTFGGVLEHPAQSRAFKYYGIGKPGPDRQWRQADSWGGYVCEVEQGHYGHPMRKTTLLYGVGITLKPLEWGKSAATKTMIDGDEPSHKERKLTPAPFRDLLLSLVQQNNSEREVKE